MILRPTKTVVGNVNLAAQSKPGEPGEVVGYILRPEFRMDEILCGGCRYVIYYRGNAFSRYVRCTCGLVNDIQARPGIQ